MEWNVENLFDTTHDTLKNDTEFLPEGDRRWTTSRYWRKLNDICSTIMAIGEGGHLPVVIGLCEVENDTVMRDLTQRSPLRNASYGYVITDSPDERGVDVAILYKKGMFRLLGHESKRVPSVQKGFKPTRDILHAWGLIMSGDTLHVIVCHLPSRAGGLQSSDAHRALAAQTLKQTIDSIRAVNADCHLVVMGDFNATPTDKIFKKILKPSSIIDSIEPTELYTLMPTSKANLRREHGTYRYQGLWSFIDHIIATGNLIPQSASDGSALKVATYDWLVEPNNKYGGVQPRRTYGGTYYKGGISDHLPIYVDLVTHQNKGL